MFHDLAVFLSMLGAAGITTWLAHRRGGRATPRRTGVWDVAKTWIQERSRIAMERERRITTLETLELIATLQSQQTGPEQEPVLDVARGEVSVRGRLAGR